MEAAPVTPGLRGLVALPVVALSATCIAAFLVQRQRQASPEAAQLVQHSVVAVVVGTVFWFWAAYKVLALHDPDFGVVTFLVANVVNYRTADLCAVLANRPRRSTITSLMQQQRLQPLANVLVACNYLVVLLVIPTLPGTFQFYLVIGGAFWIAAAWRVHALHKACDFASGMTSTSARSSAGRDGAGDDDSSCAPLQHGTSDVEDAGLMPVVPNQRARGC